MFFAGPVGISSARKWHERRYRTSHESSCSRYDARIFIFKGSGEKDAKYSFFSSPQKHFDAVLPFPTFYSHTCDWAIFKIIAFSRSVKYSSLQWPTENSLLRLDKIGHLANKIWKFLHRTSILNCYRHFLLEGASRCLIDEILFNFVWTVEMDLIGISILKLTSSQSAWKKLAFARVMHAKK